MLVARGFLISLPGSPQQAALRGDCASGTAGLVCVAVLCCIAFSTNKTNNLSTHTQQGKKSTGKVGSTSS